MTIESVYKEKCASISDINEHLPTLCHYGKEVSHITEFGVRWGGSTWAFLMSKPSKLISYDILKTPPVEGIINQASAEGVNFTFIEADTLDISIEETDLLFIDTLHTYAQLRSELEMHHMKVRKYIVLHDTHTYGISDMKYNGKISEKIKSINAQYENKHGLIGAVNDFISAHKEWQVLKVFHNNNGLTILKK